MNVCLVGTAPASIQLGPYNSPDWEVWACSPGTYGVVPNIKRFFELHRWEPGQPWFSPEYVKFLENFEGDVIMSGHVESVKNCKVLDFRTLVEKYGPYFFTSSLAWMMALAIEAGAKKIALYGVDMAHNTEYHDQRMGCQYFATIAKAKGIEVGVPLESDLLRPAPLYGICEQSHAWIKQTARSRELAQRLEQAKRRAEAARDEINFINGVVDDQDWQLHSWFGNIDTIDRTFTEPPEIPVLKEL